VHEPQALLHPLRAVRHVAVLVLVGDAEPDVLGHRVRVEQRAVLEHVADAAAQQGQLVPLELGDVQPVHDHVPESGLSSPLIIFRVTLFPTPEGPSSATVSPSCTSRLTPSSTTFERKRLEMFWSWIISHRATAAW